MTIIVILISSYFQDNISLDSSAELPSKNGQKGSEEEVEGGEMKYEEEKHDQVDKNSEAKVIVENGQHSESSKYEGEMKAQIIY